MKKILLLLISGISCTFPMQHSIRAELVLQNSDGSYRNASCDGLTCFPHLYGSPWGISGKSPRLFSLILLGLCQKACLPSQGSTKFEAEWHEDVVPKYLGKKIDFHSMLESSPLYSQNGTLRVDGGEQICYLASAISGLRNSSALTVAACIIAARPNLNTLFIDPHIGNLKVSIAEKPSQSLKHYVVTFKK